MEVEVVAVVPLQVTVAPFTGCPSNVTCPYTETTGVSDNASGADAIARRVAAISVLNTILSILLISIYSPFIFSGPQFEGTLTQIC